MGFGFGLVLWFINTASPKSSVLKNLISTTYTKALCSFSLFKVTYISIEMLIFLCAITFQG